MKACMYLEKKFGGRHDPAASARQEWELRADRWSGFGELSVNLNELLK